MDYVPPKNLLAGRIILITGAGDGIGRAAALSCARYGATVILSGRTTEKLESVYDEIYHAMTTSDDGLSRPAPSSTMSPTIVPMDLARITQADAQQLARSIDSQYGRLDGLLHNAALLGERLPFEHTSIERWQEVMQVNLHAPLLLSHALLPLLECSDDGRLLFTSAGVGSKPRAYLGAYSVSKYALEGLAKLIADELEKTSKVRVNLINPGSTRTSMRATAFPAEDPQTLKTPEALMPLYLYLLGPDSRQEHGRTFTEDTFRRLL